ncbi:MAG: glutaredoxin 3 [Alcanivorax sp.]
MPSIEIYSTKTCPYCVRAKQLLDRKGAEYVVYDVTGNQDARDKMTERAGGSHTVPQIFINDVHYGGCDDLYALDADGKLDLILAG